MAVYSALAASTSAVLNIAWTGTQPTPGDKVVVVFWSATSGTPKAISSVADNATSPNTLTAGPTRTDVNTQQVYCYWLDLPANATWSGNYTVKVTFASAPADISGGGGSYSGITSGAPVNTNTNSGSSASATSGSVSPTGSPTGLYVGGVNNGTGSNPASPFTVASPMTARQTQTNGSTQQAGMMADDVNGSGSVNATWTIQNVSWEAVIAFWANAAAPAPPAWVQQYRARTHPGRAWRLRVGSVPTPRGQASPANFAPATAHRRRLPARRPVATPMVLPPQPQPLFPTMPASTPRRRLVVRPAPRWAPLVPAPVLPQGPVYVAPPQTRRPPPAVLPRRAQPPRVPGQARPPAIVAPRPYLSRPVLRRRRPPPLVLALAPPPVMLTSPARRPAVLPGQRRRAPMVFPFVAPPVPPAFLQAPPRVRTHVELAWHRPPGLVPTAAIQPPPVPPTHCTPSVGPNWQWIDGYCCQQMAGNRIAVDGGHVAVTNRVVWVDGIGQAYDPARP